MVASGKDILKNVERFGYSLEYHDTFQPKFTFLSSDDADIYKNMPDVNIIYPGGQASDGANAVSYTHLGAGGPGIQYAVL